MKNQSRKQWKTQQRPKQETKQDTQWVNRWKNLFRRMLLTKFAVVFSITLAIILAVIFTAAIGSSLGQQHKVQMQQHIAQAVFRLHIRANSDGAEDQAQKMQVKEQVVQYLEPLLNYSNSKEQSIEVVKNHLEEITQVARETITAAGNNCSVGSWVGYSAFPEKVYGSYTLPAGDYEALIISIGKGTGQNWWCMLYPGLCFLDQACQIVTDETDQKLQENLTSEEFQWILDPKKTEFDFLWF